ncbi:beta strand repeat-containing protein [Liquorilactobacillus satsumensis]|uniref:beta strand repeat-containing protein n=1 Tax=Liquorilactobacillus satsumensis TaxID=259059 RepID=UPI0039E734F7
MITQSDKALEAWKATERVLDAIVTINGTDYHTTDITSIAYDSGAFTGDTFAIGSTYENGLTIEFSHIVEGLEQGQKVTAKVGIKTSDGTYEYCPLGVFIVSDDIEMDRNNDLTTIKCYNQMCLLEGTYTSKLSYPASAADIIAEIANMAGVMLSTDEIAKLPALTSLANAISGQTYRDAIGWIAQFYAGFATFDRDGKLTIRTIAAPDYTLNPSQYEQAGLTKNEAPYKIGGIQCEVTTTTTDSTGESTDNTVTLQVGDSTGSQIKLTNNLMTQERLEMVWAQLKDINFYPYSLNWFGNPAIEAGDWLTLQDTKGNKFNVPNNSYTMTFDGSFSAVSKADQTSTSSSTYAWNGQLTQVVKTLVGKLTPAGNFIYGPETTDEPTGAKFNDLWYKQNGNKLEMWTYERQSDGSGKWSQTLSDATGEDVKSAVAANQAEAEIAKTNSQNAVDKADSAIQQAVSAYTLGSNANQLASDAKNDAVAALTNSNTALNDAKSALTVTAQNSNDITAVQADLSSAKTDLQNKITENTTAISNAQSSINTVSSDLASTKTNLQTVSDKATQNGKDINTTNSTVSGIQTDLANTKGDVTELQTTASGLSADMVSANGDISSLKARAGSLESNMSTATGDISTLKQTASSLTSAMSGKVDNTVYQSDKTQTANSISSVVSTINNLGVVNLLTGTTDDTVMTANSHNFHFVTIYTSLIPGKTYTFSAEVTLNGSSSNKVSIKVYNSDNSGAALVGTDTFVADGTRQSWTFTVPNNGANLLIYSGLQGSAANITATYHHMKLESGTVSTPWSPAPSDKANQTDFSATQQTVNGLTTTVSSHTGDISSLKQTATTMQSDIKDNADNIAAVNLTAQGLQTSVTDAQGNISVLQQDVGGLKVTTQDNANNINSLQTTAHGLTVSMQDAQGNIASLQATAQNITQTVSDTNTRIDNLDYANTNLLTNSGTFKATWGYFGSIDTSSPAIFHYSGTVDNYRDFLNQPNLAGLSSIQQTYTIGFWAKGTGILTTYVYPGVGGGNNHHTWSLTSEWQYFTQNFDTHASDTDMGNKTFLFRNNKEDNPSGSLDVYITKPKLEQGSTATDWSPAPQDFTDLSTIVTGHTTQIEQNAAAINLKANSTDVDQLAGRVSTAEGNISVMAGQIQTKVTQNDINNSLAGYATQDWTSGQISVKANEINSTVSQVQTHLDNLQIGGRNIIPNSSMSVLENTGWTFNPATARIDGTDTAIDVLTGTMSAEISRDITGVQPNTDYCISIDLDWGEYDSSKVGSFEAHVFFVERRSDGSTTATYVDNNYNISNSDPRQGYTFKTQPDTAGGTLIVRAGPYNKIIFKELEMQTGTKFGPWSPAPADLATVTALSSVSQKADSISTTVTNYKSDADSKFSTINQTISGIQSTVANKAEQSQLTQLAGQVTSTINSINTINKNLSWQTVTAATDLNTMQTQGQFFMKGTLSNSPVVAWAYLTVEKVDSTRLKQTVQKDNSNDQYVRYYNGSWSAWSQSANYSQITQLNSMIDARVTKNGVINAVNISSEGIQIYGDKLHITASTYIDNAVIKSAMIDTLSADKITVGTLNGANVNVINLNAANITTGTLSGSNLSLNLDTGEVLFQKGAIKSTDGLLDIEINDGTFSQNNSSGDGFIFRNGNIYFSNKSSWAAWDAPLYGTISLNERAFAAGQGGMAIKGAKNVVVQTDDYNGDFVMGPPPNLTGSGLLLREDRIEMASAQTYLYGGLGYSYINHPFIEIGTSIWENQYNDNAGSNVLIRASGIILDGDVMSLNGFHIANNYITTAGDGLWVNSAFGSGGNATIHAQSFSQTSLLSKKTNVIPLDRLKARDAIRTVDIQEYMYKDDVENGITKKYSSGIIDDINEKPKYSMPFDWISADGKGREDGTALGYTIVAVQDLYDQIEDLKEQVKQLKGESAA